MNRKNPVSKAERTILVVLASALLVCVLVAFGSDFIDEVRLSSLHARYLNFAVDAPNTALAGLNLITISLFLSVVFVRRYIVSGVLTLLYIGLLSFGIYMRLDGRGFLGGEDFYQNPVTEILAKTHWFELLLPIVLITSLLIHARILFRTVIFNPDQPEFP